MLAVVPVRGGSLPIGGAEAVAEAGGDAIVIGDGTLVAAEELAGVARRVRTVELPTFAPAAWAEVLAGLVGDDAVVLPGSPDGRDLAPRLAHRLGVALHAGAVGISAARVTLARHHGLVLEDVAVSGRFVATLIPGVRGVETATRGVEIEQLTATASTAPGRDATVIEVLPPDVATMDLAEAPRILGGGAGLESADRFTELAEVATALHASVGATRVVTDRGWLGHERQIGTTGVVVNPKLYLAFGISGAVQHTTGLGNPDHVISVNTDASCPMMQLADVAIVADANAVVAELKARLCRG